MTSENRRKIAIILAAGDGKRMKSDRPKVLCEVLFKPMLRWVEDTCRAAGIEEIYIVAGEQAELLRAAVTPGCSFFLQKERLGTGHAVMMAAQALEGGGDAVVLYGDAPFITPQTIEEAWAQHRRERNAVTVVSARVGDPTGYGRIIRDGSGAVKSIVEQRDATEEQRRIDEINSGVYWFDTAFLAGALKRLTPQNVQGEYYLTDTLAIAVSDGLPAGGYICPDASATLGANDRRQLKALNEIARQMVIDRHLDGGVEIPCDDGVMIGPDVQIGHDACILPGTVLKGRTVIGPHAVIGPNSYLEDASIGAGTLVKASYMTRSTVGECCTVGPFAHFRPDSHLGNGVKIGDFVEIKNSTIGDKTAVAHLTYIGDSDVGSLCNFGCGVVVANYDGRKKYRTVIGDRAFIGCNTNLIPPVRVGDGAYTAAGTTVDTDIPDGALAIGRVRQEIKEGWSDAHIAFKQSK